MSPGLFDKLFSVDIYFPRAPFYELLSYSFGPLSCQQTDSPYRSAPRYPLLALAYRSFSSSRRKPSIDSSNATITVILAYAGKLLQSGSWYTLQLFILDYIGLSVLNFCFTANGIPFP